VSFESDFQSERSVPENAVMRHDFKRAHHAVKRRRTAPRIAAIVLAAGASRRMGTNKLLLPVAGESLVRRACRVALAAQLYPLIVVVGYESERVREALAGLDCRFAFNADWGGPMSGSLHRGLECLPGEAQGTVVMLADMVYVTESMLRALVLAAATSNAPLVSSRYAQILAPPVLFQRALFGELLATTGEGCGKAVVELHRKDAAYVDWPSTALMDVDTPEEFARL
jgi:molybdenum cofactor cytidylyltransferase